MLYVLLGGLLLTILGMGWILVRGASRAAKAREGSAAVPDRPAAGLSPAPAVDGGQLTSETSRWVAGQLARHDPVCAGVPGAIALARFLRVLRGQDDADPPMVFGLVVPPDGLADADVLEKRAETLLKRWLATASDAAKRRLREAVGGRAPVEVELEPEAPRRVLARVTLRYPVTLTQLDASGLELQEDIRDPSILRCFDGLTLVDGEALDVLDDPAFEPFPEVVEATLRVAFDAALRAEVGLGLDRIPDPADLERYREELSAHLWERSWAMNLEWQDPPRRPTTFGPDDIPNLTVGFEAEDLRVS